MTNLTAGIQTLANTLYPVHLDGNPALNLALQAAMADICRLMTRCRLTAAEGTDTFWGARSPEDMRRLCDLPPPLNSGLHKAIFENGIGNPPVEELVLPIEAGGQQVSLRIKGREPFCMGSESLELGCQIATAGQHDSEQHAKLWIRRLFVAPREGGPSPASEDLDIGLSTWLGSQHEPIWRRDARLEGSNYYDGDLPDNRCHIRLRRIAVSWYEQGWREAEDCLARYNGGEPLAYDRWAEAHRKLAEFLPAFLTPLDPCWALFEGLDPMTAM